MDKLLEDVKDGKVTFVEEVSWGIDLGYDLRCTDQITTIITTMIRMIRALSCLPNDLHGLPYWLGGEHRSIFIALNPLIVLILVLFLFVMGSQI